MLHLKIFMAETPIAQNILSRNIEINIYHTSHSLIVKYKNYTTSAFYLCIPSQHHLCIKRVMDEGKMAGHPNVLT